MASQPPPFPGFPGNPVSLRFLAEAVRTREIVPVLGPHISTAFLPYREFLERAAQTAGVELNPAQNVGVCARAVIDALGDRMFFDLIQDAFGDHRLPPPESEEVIEAVLRMRPPHIVTTNLDHRLIRALQERQQPFVQISGRAGPKQVSPLATMNLIQIYGDAADRNSLVTTEADFAAFVKESYAHERLGQLIQEFSLLLIGFDDPTSPRVLLQRVREAHDERVHYAVLPFPGAGPKLAEALRQCAAASIRPIWHPGGLADLVKIFDYLNDGAPVLAAESAQGTPSIASVEPPDALAEACLRGECVLVAGSGLSARAGLPTWTEFVGSLLKTVGEAELLTKEALEVQWQALRGGDANSVADNLAWALAHVPVSALDWLRRVDGSSLALPASHLLLRQIPFHAAMTTNYDVLLERTFAGTSLGEVITPLDSERLASQGQGKPFLFKLYGTAEQPQTLIWSPAEYQARVARNPQFQQFLEGVFFSRTLLFLGLSLEGIQDFLAALPSRGTVAKRHYALVAVSGTAWRGRADTLARRYGVEVIPYPLSRDHPEVDRFLQQLPRGTAQREPQRADGFSRLRRLILRDVGPFERLEVEFPGDWTVLLGDNGVGKSSILKAIAIAIGGVDTQAYAGRLVRAGQSSASIHVITDRNPSGYVTEIYQTDAQASVVSIPSRCLEAEGWVALGFPPLRTVSWARSEGPQSPGKFRPTVEDVLPLVRGEADPRMDKLKQWIVNLDYLDKSERVKGLTGTRAERTLRKFFDVVGELTGRLEVRPQEVTAGHQVLVRTPDGVVPIEALSQGLTSLFSWAGILIQRMFEVNEQLEDPTEGHALVLMDEIDAHMHPEWQRQLVPQLKRLFPKVQFIVSTHSPLIVAGMPPEEIVRFRRNSEGKVEVVPVDATMTMGRADQILTGELFGLETTLPPDTGTAMRRYQELLGCSERSEAEQTEILALERELEERIPPSPEDPVLRHAQQLLDAITALPEAPAELRQKAGLLARAMERRPPAETR